MARQEINLGVLPNGVGGDTPRVANIKINDMTEELYAAIEDGALTPEERAKLEGIAAGATKNQPDAELLDRENHTGTQLASTISDLSAAVRSVSLQGLATASIKVTAADSILAAMGKLQGQIDAADLPRIVKVGDFGIGGQLSPDVSANAAGVTRFYRSFNDANSANLGLTAGIHLQRDPDRNAEISLNWLDESMQFRVSNNMGTRGKWNKVVKYGDLGIGTEGPGVIGLADANIKMPSGKYRVFTTTLNSPGVYGTLEWSYYDAITWTQLVIAANNGGIYYRGCINDSIQPWARLDTRAVENSNGRAILLADGSMICWTTKKRSGKTAIAHGSIFYAPYIAFDWPVPFSAPPSISTECTNSMAGFCWASSNIAATTTGIAQVAAMSPINTGDADIHVVAYGRWA